ncbi:hypothetical protein EUTSA_v10024044mg, partial [Eutrema salsugineum]
MFRSTAMNFSSPVVSMIWTKIFRRDFELPMKLSLEQSKILAFYNQSFPFTQFKGYYFTTSELPEPLMVMATEKAFDIFDDEEDDPLIASEECPTRQDECPIKNFGCLCACTRNLKLGISVDVVATTEVSISLTLDPSKFCSKELIQQASLWLCNLLLYIVNLLQHRPIICLIGNVLRSSLILEKQGFRVLRTNGDNVQMISQGPSRVNILLIVNDDAAEHCVKALPSPLSLLRD